MFSIMKNAKLKKIQHQVVAEELLETCNRITDKTCSLKNKLNNGGGEAIVAAVVSMIKASSDGI